MNIPAGEPPKNRSEQVLDHLKKPKLRFIRIPVGILLVFGGLAGFLPILGFWMIPVGLTVLAIDFPAAERLLQKMRHMAGGLRRITLRRRRPQS